MVSASEGGPLRWSFYRRTYKPAVRRVEGVPDALRFHDLRHTCVGFLIAQDAHVKEISDCLGRSTVRLMWPNGGPASFQETTKGAE